MANLCLQANIAICNESLCPMLGCWVSWTRLRPQMRWCYERFLQQSLEVRATSTESQQRSQSLTF